jgi:dTDP-4-amino-4,6-dideoxygalactose transaminase
MNILMNNFKLEYQSIKIEIDKAIQRVLDSGWYVLSDEVTQFENQVASFLKIKHAIGTGNGFDALQAILIALNIKDGDEVITTPNSAFATTLSILRVGAKPVFVDILDGDYSIDFKQIEKYITKKTKAIIPVHIYGNSNHIDEIKNICDNHNICLIEDSCQAFGAKFNFKYAGTMGIAGAYSYYPTKNLGAYGDAGMVVTDNDDLARRIRMIINYGQSKRYYHDLIGFNSRLDPMQAAILSIKLKYIIQYNKTRIDIAKEYDSKITNEKLIKPVLYTDGSHIYHLYVLRTKEREKLSKYLEENGVKSLIHYPIPIYKQVPLQKDFALISLPNAEKFADEYISIPIHPFITTFEVNYIIDLLNKF